jgi:hypothetical protein
MNNDAVVTTTMSILMGGQPRHATHEHNEGNRSDTSQLVNPLLQSATCTILCPTRESLVTRIIFYSPFQEAAVNEIMSTQPLNLKTYSLTID